MVELYTAGSPLHGARKRSHSAPKPAQTRASCTPFKELCNYQASRIVDRRAYFPDAVAAGSAMLSHMPPSSERPVKLFRNDRNQAVRIPREFELPGEDAVMRKEGDRLVIEPAQPRSLLATLEPLEEEFPTISELPLDPVDI